MSNELFRVRDLWLRRGDKTVLHGASFVLNEGEILCIYGPYGAGKTLLLKLIEGENCMESGNIFVRGKHIATPSQSPLKAVSVSDISLINDRTVWENLMVMRERNKLFSVCNSRVLRAAAMTLFKDYGISLNPDLLVKDLNAANQFKIKLFKAYLRHADVFLVDDFNLQCSEEEHDNICRLMHRFTDEGASFVISGSRREILMRYSEHLSLMSDGNLIRLPVAMRAGLIVPNESIEQLQLSDYGEPDRDHKIGNAVLSLGNIDYGAKERVFLDFKQGELSFLVDKTRSFADALRTALQRVRTNCSVIIVDENAADSVYDRMTALENLCISASSRFSRFGLINRRSMKYIAVRFNEWYGDDSVISAPNCRHLSRSEKTAIFMFRLMLMKPDVVVCINASEQMDVNTRGLYERCLVDLTNNGCAVCVISSPNEKILESADRCMLVSNDLFIDNLSRERLAILAKM